MVDVPRRPGLMSVLFGWLRWMLAPPRWLMWGLAYATVALLAALVALNVYVSVVVASSPNRVTREILCVSVELAPHHEATRALRQLQLPATYCRTVHLRKG